MNAVQERRRERLFGRRAVTAALIFKNGTYSPSLTTLDSDRISELRDPDLRYALRLADAASSAGWKEEGPGSLSGHHVIVLATDKGLESRFLEASYTGTVDAGTDTSLEDLHRFDPARNQS
jgi:dipeptidyl aminopeptidase/acylaminoacyl peptidase